MSMQMIDLTDRTPVVVTGQQAGLFGGPLYTLYKLLGACAIAADRGARAVFWIEADDADVAEVDQVTLLDGDGPPRTVTTGEVDDGRPVADRTFGAGLLAAIAAVEAAAGTGELAVAAVANLRAAYAPGRPWHLAFGDYLAGLVAPHPIEFLDPASEPFKRAAAPLFARVLREAEAVEAALAAGSLLVDPPQVPHLAFNLPLFVLDDQGRRRKLLRSGSGFELKGGGGTFRLEQVIALLDQSPERFSAAVLLRPLVQDFVLPTVAYVTGPSERRYHGQLGPLYQHFGMTRPELIDCPSFTLLDARVRRTLERLGATPEEAIQGEAALAARAVRAATGLDPVARAAATLAAIDLSLEALRSDLAPIDPKPLAKAFDDVQQKLNYHLTKLGQRAAELLARKDDETARRAQTVANFVLPNGKPQERVFGPVQVLAAIAAPDLVATLLARIDPKQPGRHQFVDL